MKLLQLNIEKGRFLNDVIDYVHKENFDVIHFQEVTGGQFSYGEADCYQRLQTSLNNYSGSVSRSLGLISDPQAYYANATFVKKNLPVAATEELWLGHFTKIDQIPGNNDPRWMEKPCTALCVQVNIAQKKLWLINTHLPWSPRAVDTGDKTVLGNKIYDFVEKEKKPFVFTGDLNIRPGTKLINHLNTLGRNLIEENSIINTLNLATHKSAARIFPPGLAVDFIFVDRSLTVENFHVVDRPTLSDHLGLFLDFIPA